MQESQGKFPPGAGTAMPGKSRREPEPLASGENPAGSRNCHAGKTPPGVGAAMPGETRSGSRRHPERGGSDYLESVSPFRARATTSSSRYCRVSVGRPFLESR